MDPISAVGASTVAAIDPTASTQLSVATEIARSVALVEALQNSTGETLAKVVGHGDADPPELLELHMKTAALRVGIETTSNMIAANKNDLKLVAGNVT